MGLVKDMQDIRSIIASVPDFWAHSAYDGHVGLIGERNAESILNALDEAGYEIVAKQQLSISRHADKSATTSGPEML